MKSLIETTVETKRTKRTRQTNKTKQTKQKEMTPAEYAEYFNIELPSDEKEVLGFYLDLQHDLENFFKYVANKPSFYLNGADKDAPFVECDMIWKIAEDMLWYARKNRLGVLHLSSISKKVRNFRLSLRLRTTDLVDLVAMKTFLSDYFFNIMVPSCNGTQDCTVA